MVIQATSAGHYAGGFVNITINEVAIQMDQNEDNKYRGLHIVIINPFNGMVEVAKVFDTYKDSDGFDTFIKSLKNIPNGSIIVAACEDECITHLSQKGKEWFINMGSKEIESVEYRQGYAFIGKIGQTDCTEKRAVPTSSQVSISRIHVINKVFHT